MTRGKLISGLCLGLIGFVYLTALMVAATDTQVADAAMKGNKEAVRSLIKQAADVNAAQGDGMTALHWAALNGDVEIAKMLLYAGANLKATTRLGAYTPLSMAAKAGNSAIVGEMLKAGADPKAAGANGLTPLMMAATSGDPDAVRMLLERGADPNAKESDRGQTALAFAASFNRADAIRVLLKHGADANLPSNIVQPVAAPARGGQRGGIPTVGGGRGQGQNADQTAAAGAAAQAQFLQNLGEEGGKGGGNPKGRLTPLMYAARQGSFDAATALVDGGAKLNALNGDNSTALFLAIINGKFDIARLLVERGADVSIATVDGGTPLYAVVNTQWARKSFQPQPSARYEKTTYLQLMNVLLDRGADPNARLGRELWFAEYNRDLQTVTTAGATAFWKCADVGDIDGMRLLVSRGANPNLTTTEGVTALLIAAGAGVHGNDDVTAPMGRLAAVKYLVEELHLDVNAADTGSGGRGQGVVGAATEPQSAASGATPPGTQQQQQPAPRRDNGGFTALHNAAARGDNAMILYLVSKGARVDAVSRGGVTIADMANGPRQRIQPYPETVALLEQLGSKNSHKCVSC